jgi:PAS domain S-box-containing protein
VSLAGDAGVRLPSSLLPRAIESLADGIVVGDLAGRCLLANAAARRLFGEELASLHGDALRSALGCFLPDMVTPCPAADQPLARTLRGEVVHGLELVRLRTRIVECVWLSVDGTPVCDSRGSIEAAMLVFRDVTATRKKIQQVELLSNVVDATADAVIVTDRAGRIEYVNPAFEAATGYTRAEALGRKPSILKSGAHPAEFYAGLWRALVEGRVFRGTFVNRKKSGELFFTEQTITPIRRPGGGITHVVSVGKDVTQLRRAAERESTLLLARSVQQRLFPPSAPTVPGYDVYGATFVADVTGGDYYDFISLPDHHLGLLVADVSGHGVDSALLMAETRAVLRATAQATAEPSEILAVVSRVLHGDTEPHRFATLLLASLHLPSGSLAYASAGHPAGYLLDGRGAVKSALPATGLPLGLFPDSRYETRADLRLETGDTLVLLTDGVTDSSTRGDDFFGSERALETMRPSLGGHSSDIVEGLYRAVRAFEEGKPQSDDVTTVVARRLPRP